MQSAIEQEIEKLITPILDDMGLNLVKLSLSGQRLMLQIMIERIDDTPISIDNCSKASKAISAILDVNDTIKSAYTLEVGSAGLDRPLVKQADFIRFIGRDAKIDGIIKDENGRRHYKGKLIGFENELITIEEDGVEHKIEFSNILKAKLSGE